MSSDSLAETASLEKSQKYVAVSVEQFRTEHLTEYLSRNYSSVEEYVAAHAEHKRAQRQNTDPIKTTNSDTVVASSSADNFLSSPVIFSKDPCKEHRNKDRTVSRTAFLRNAFATRVVRFR